MAVAITMEHFQYLLEVETAVPGTFVALCGMKTVNISRQKNMDTTEVPDCDDASLPFAVLRSPRSTEVTVSASGVWARTSNKTIEDWFYSNTTKNIRLRKLAAAVGDPETESGPAYLTKYDNATEKGQRVTADLEIQFDGIPVRANKV